ncbi:MAG TPA: hypothetical protein VND19_01890 [Acetobacteraceae bacterium]|nr:hypothetical protein [Acetobacteraceae bacterium]
MTNEELIERVYVAYNRQDAEVMLAFVSEDVDGPDGQARLDGNQELRTYWMRQWAETRTRDEVLAIATPIPNRSIVGIGQIVRALTDAVISTGTFEHDYLIEDRLIMRLDIRRL